MKVFPVTIGPGLESFRSLLIDTLAELGWTSAFWEEGAGRYLTFFNIRFTSYCFELMDRLELLESDSWRPESMEVLFDVSPAVFLWRTARYTAAAGFSGKPRDRISEVSFISGRLLFDSLGPNYLNNCARFTFEPKVPITYGSCATEPDLYCPFIADDWAWAAKTRSSSWLARLGLFLSIFNFSLYIDQIRYYSLNSTTVELFCR